MSKQDKADSIEIMQEYITYHAKNPYKKGKEKSETESARAIEVDRAI